MSEMDTQGLALPLGDSTLVRALAATGQEIIGQPMAPLRGLILLAGDARLDGLELGTNDEIDPQLGAGQFMDVIDEAPGAVVPADGHLTRVHGQPRAAAAGRRQQQGVWPGRQHAPERPLQPAFRIGKPDRRAA